MDHVMGSIETNNTNYNYPPYNTIKSSDDNYIIEIAVAGFGIDDITITEHNGKLDISGEKVFNEDQEVKDNYLHKGISSRKFVRSFDLADYVKVTSADIENGILTVGLERIVPDEMKPKTIAIKQK
jgi:molecular chaperone IbpA